MKIQLRCDGPVTHGAFGESAGNATLCRRMPIVSLPGMPLVPCVSGNALRGTMRRLVMRELLARAGASRATLGGSIWDRLYAALCNGGHLDGSETRVDPDAIRKLREDLPPLSVFGAALYSWMMPGHMSVGILWPVCRETVQAGLVDGVSDVAAEDLVVEVSHCRHVEREHQDPEVSGVTPMPTTVEALAPGCVLESRIDFADHASDIERAVVAHAASKLSAIGGKHGSGFGAVALACEAGDPAPYRKWLDQCGDLAERVRRLAVTLAPQKREKPAKAAKIANPSPFQNESDAAS